jgi:hypothetical protein
MLLTSFYSAYLPYAPFARTCSDKSSFFFIPVWYKYLPVTDTNNVCSVVFNVPDDFLPVGLAIVEMLLRLGGLAATISIIIAGVGYITAGGDAQKAASARRRIVNSLVGLAIVFVASGFVAFVGNRLAT